LFGIGGWEFILIAVLALLLFGPDKLPQFARTLGRFMRDFKRYQDLMESTIRGEIFAADPTLQKDPFETGKEFRKKVAGGRFSKPVPPTKAEAESDEVPAPEAAEVESEAPVEAAPAEELESAMTGEIALDEPDELPPPAEDGEGERDEA